MYKLVTIVLFRMRLILKTKITVIMLFVLPIVFSLIFAGLGLTEQRENSLAKVGLVIEQCHECDSVAEYLKRNIQYNWIEYDIQLAKVAVTEEKIVAAVIIPYNFFERLEKSDPVFDVIVNKKTEVYIPLSQYIDSVANQLHMFKTTLSIIEQTSTIKQSIDYVNSVAPVEFEYEYYQVNSSDDNKQISLSTTISIGFAVMFMIFALSNSASVIHHELKEYTWQRLLITGTSSITIILGTMIAYFLVGWIQFATFILFMKFVYGVYWGNALYLFLFSSVMIMSVVSFSMLLVTLFNSKERADIFSLLIVVSTCMLGGLYWPVDLVPPFMRFIGSFTPQYWMMKGLEYGLMNETSIEVVWLPFTLLTGITIVFTAIMTKLLNKENKLA